MLKKQPKPLWTVAGHRGFIYKDKRTGCFYTYIHHEDMITTVKAGSTERLQKAIQNYFEQQAVML